VPLSTASRNPRATRDRRDDRQGANMKVEPILAKLNELRKEAAGDPEDLEYLALHHAFCFISYHTGDFQKYLDEHTSDDD
jgi:hypothetical protein